ncbi:hypothetical protein F2P79_020271, partial [Pimephales promelas]
RLGSDRPQITSLMSFRCGSQKLLSVNACSHLRDDRITHQQRLACAGISVRRKATAAENWPVTPET